MTAPDDTGTRKIITVHCEVQFILRADGDVAAALPGRQALCDAISRLLLPDGHEYVTMMIQDHKWTITACHRLHGIEMTDQPGPIAPPW